MEGKDTASYLDDSDYPVDRNEENSGDVESFDETVDTVADLQQETLQFGNLCKKFDQISSEFDLNIKLLKRIVNKGVDSTFLYFYGDRFAAAGISIPDSASCHAIGDPKDEVSIACMEGIGDALHKIWEFIRGMCRKVINFITGFFKKVEKRVNNINETIGKLKARVDRLSANDLSTHCKGFEVPNLKLAVTNSSKRSKASDAFVDFVKELTNRYNHLQSGFTDAEIEDLSKKSEEVEKEWLSRDLVWLEDNRLIDASTLSIYDLRAALDVCGVDLRRADNIETCLNTLKAQAQGVFNTSINYEQRASEWLKGMAEDAVKRVQKYIAILNKATFAGARIISITESNCRHVTMVVARIIAHIPVSHTP